MTTHTMHFEAIQVESAEDDDGIAFAMFRGPDHHYLALSRSLAPTEQDRHLGHDQVHVEIDDQAFSAYGGVAFGTLAPSHLSLSLDPRSSASLRVASLVVSFALSDERLCTLRAAVKVLFAGCPTFTTVA